MPHVTRGHLRQQSANSPGKVDKHAQIKRAPEGEQRIAISVVEKRNTTSASVPDVARAPRTDWGQNVGNR